MTNWSNGWPHVTESDRVALYILRISYVHGVRSRLNDVSSHERVYTLGALEFYCTHNAPPKTHLLYADLWTLAGEGWVYQWSKIKAQSTLYGDRDAFEAAMLAVKLTTGI